MAHIDTTPISIDGIKTWIFDLDNTIYPAASRLFDQVRHRMTDYIQHHFALERDARAMQRDLFCTDNDERPDGRTWHRPASLYGFCA